MAQDSLAAAQSALARGAWDEARTAYEASLIEDPTPEAWDGLGWTGWWQADEGLTLRAREQAYRLYRARGDNGDAARVAAWLAADYREFRGDEAVARGWLVRAHRLLDDLPEGPDHGWLAVLEADVMLNFGDELAEVERLSLEAARIGREFGVPDLEAVGLGQAGAATVVRGDVTGGMRLLDEASAIASGEDLQFPISQAWAMCSLISACDGVGDFPRAAQWAEQMRGFTDRWGGRQLLGMCRSAYGRVLATRGDWESADSELTAAVEDLETARPAMSGADLVRLAELRVRQGRTDEARELYERAGAAGQLGLAELALDAGDSAAAEHAAERVLRRTPSGNVLGRLPALALLVRARARSGRFEEAHEACEEVHSVSERLGTPYLRGRARLCKAELSAARGEHDEARRSFEDAIDCFAAGSAPYEGAIAQLGLAQALSALGYDTQAAAEALAARETFSALGAARDAERAQLPAVSTNGGAGALSELTARELEVLKLVAQGLSDREIAERLVVSPHTVHRHVANVRTKLRLPSRSAAVAYAARCGLL
jgi:ATP/maltotriose-dependent transcriptional regulator MalT